MSYPTIRESLTPPFWVAMGFAVLIAILTVAGVVGVIPSDLAMFTVRVLMFVGVFVPLLMLKLNKRWGDIARRSRERSWENLHNGSGWRRWLGLESKPRKKRSHPKR